MAPRLYGPSPRCATLLTCCHRVRREAQPPIRRRSTTPFSIDQNDIGPRHETSYRRLWNTPPGMSTTHRRPHLPAALPDRSSSPSTKASPGRYRTSRHPLGKTSGNEPSRRRPGASARIDVVGPPRRTSSHAKFTGPGAIPRSSRPTRPRGRHPRAYAAPLQASARAGIRDDWCTRPSGTRSRWTLSSRAPSNVSGDIRMILHGGRATVNGRRSGHSLRLQHCDHTRPAILDQSLTRAASTSTAFGQAGRCAVLRFGVDMGY